MNISDLPQNLTSAQRIELHTAIMNAIIRLSPEFDDAVEIVDALHEALKRRYPPEALWDVEHYCEYFTRSLERGPHLLPQEKDEMAAYKDYLALYGERE